MYYHEIICISSSAIKIIGECRFQESLPHLCICMQMPDARENIRESSLRRVPAIIDRVVTALDQTVDPVSDKLRKQCQPDVVALEELCELLPLGLLACVVLHLHRSLRARRSDITLHAVVLVARVLRISELLWTPNMANRAIRVPRFACRHTNQRQFFWR